MKVSIIVPTFDREDTIERCLESALNQTYDDIEVIVVDNCSQDRTVERCRQYSGDSRLKIYENNENVGPCRNWQRCIDMSSGDFIKFLFSDDVLSPDCIEAQVNAFSRDVAFVVSPAKIYLNQSGQPTLFWTFPAGTTRVPVEQFIENSLFTSRYPVTPVCALFRTEDVRSHFNASFDAPIGGDPSKHGIGPDLLLYLQIAHSYAKLGTKSVCRLAQPLCTFPYNPSSISVRSSGKRLYLRYLLAKAYFVTNSAPNYTSRFVGFLFAHILLLRTWETSDRLRLEDFMIRKEKREVVDVCLGFAYGVLRIAGVPVRKLSRSIFAR